MRDERGTTNPPPERERALAVAFTFLATWVAATVAACSPTVPSLGRQAAVADQQLVVLPEDGADVALADIAAAKTSLRLEAYLLTDERAMDALRAACERSVRVEVLLEPAPYGSEDANQAAFALLRDSGIEVHWARRPSGFMHAKTWLVDDALVDVGTANLTRSGLQRNRELVLRTRDEATSATLGRLLADDAQGLGDDTVAEELGVSAGLANQPLLVSPFRTREAMTSLIASAQTSLVLVTELFDDPALAEGIAARARAGVRVTLLVSAADAIPDAQASALADAGTDLRVLSSPYLHAKALLADDARYLVGSPNLTRASLDVNREVALRGDAPAVAARLGAVFAADARTAKARTR